MPLNNNFGLLALTVHLYVSLPCCLFAFYLCSIYKLKTTLLYRPAICNHSSLRQKRQTACMKGANLFCVAGHTVYSSSGIITHLISPQTWGISGVTFSSTWEEKGVIAPLLCSLLPLRVQFDTVTHSILSQKQEDVSGCDDHPCGWFVELVLCECHCKIFCLSITFFYTKKCVCVVQSIFSPSTLYNTLFIIGADSHQVAERKTKPVVCFPYEMDKMLRSFYLIRNSNM